MCRRRSSVSTFPKRMAARDRWAFPPSPLASHYGVQATPASAQDASGVLPERRRQSGPLADHAVRLSGHTFRDRCVRLRTGQRVTGFTPAVSRKAMKRMGGQIKHWCVGRQVHRTAFELAGAYRSTLQGWLNYYGRFTRSGLSALWWYFDNRLVSWVHQKCRKRYCSVAQAARWLARVRQRYPTQVVSAPGFHAMLNMNGWTGRAV